MKKIQSHYEQHKPEFRSIEAVKVEIAELTKLKKGLPPSPLRKKLCDDKLHRLFCKLAQLEKESGKIELK